MTIAQPAPAQLLDAVKRSAVIKSELDTREYRYITLANQLTILLVSDSKVEKSAAALNIRIGNRQDPEQYPGLAQLLQRVLLDGSEAYPEAGGYQQFISRRGGEQHALTAAHNSQYYFTVDNAALEPALDRFAGFLLAPLLAASAIELEKNTLNAEYLAALSDRRLRSDPSLREWDVYRSLFNPLHPAARFPGGILSASSPLAADSAVTAATSSQANGESDLLREYLLSFHREYYSANLMTLVLVSNQSLDNLQKMVEARFASMPNNSKVVDAPPSQLFSDGALPASISVQAATDLQQLSFSFPVPNLTESYQTKPWTYIAHLLRGEAEGSLLFLLKSLGWAEAISISELPVTSRENMFQISIALTLEGAKARDQIVSAVFEYIKTIGLHGINDWRFGELKQMAEIEFRFQDKLPPLALATELAQAMQDYPAKDVLCGKYSYNLFDEGLIQRALGYLRKDNVLVTWTAASVKTAAVSRYYQVPYSAAPGIPEVGELKPLYRQKLSLPERNMFIPKNTSVKVPSMRFAQGDVSAKNSPSLLFSNDQFNMWFLQDQYYRSPKAELNFRVILPMLNNSLENAARNQLFIALVMDKLNEITYPANFAGLTFTASANARGFDLHLSGYTDRQSLLLNKITDVMAQASFNPNRFAVLKERLIRQGLNEDKSSPSAILIRKISRLQYQPDWDASEYASALQNTSFSTFKSFTAELLRDAKIDSLFYGNLYPQDAIKLAALVDHQLLKKKGNRVLQSAKGFRTDNRANKSWLYLYPVASEQHALVLYIPALSPTIGSSAHSLLLNHLLQPIFINKLQSGGEGSAALLSLPLKNLESSVVVLQSPQASGEQMLAKVNSLLLATPEFIPENFSPAKTLLLTQLRKAPASLSQQSEKFWQSILLGDITFTRQQELIAAVAAISAESLTEYYRNTFLQKNRRLWLSSSEIDTGKEFERIGNIAEYQQKQQGYLYP